MIRMNKTYLSKLVDIFILTFLGFPHNYFYDSNSIMLEFLSMQQKFENEKRELEKFNHVKTKTFVSFFL